MGMAKKRNPKNSIEELARMIKTGFDKTATKEDLAELRKETKEGFSFLNQAIENLDVRVSSYATEWNKRFSEPQEWIEQLEDRLKTLERRLSKT